MFFQNKFTFGGNNGLTDFKTMLGANLNDADVRRNLYIATVLLLIAVVALVKWLLGTKFGKVQKAIRDSENRVLFSGYATTSFKLFIFVLCALIAGAAGALYVPQVGIINPSEMTTDKSLEAVVWVAVGGRATLLGPVYGAIFVNALKSWATTAYPDYWYIILGGLFRPRSAFRTEWHRRPARADQGHRRMVEAPQRPCDRTRRDPRLTLFMSSQVILAAEGVNKAFDGFKAINDLNFYLDEGELRTVIGPNGAGKSTFLDLITGRTRLDSGKITFGTGVGEEITSKKEYEIYRMGMAGNSKPPASSRNTAFLIISCSD